MSRDDLAGKIGAHLGFGRERTAWTSNQAIVVDDSLDSGCRQFYFPPPLPNEATSHAWSFLKPVVAVTLAEGASLVALPEDCGGLEGKLTVSTEDTGLFFPLTLVGLGEVLTAQTAWPSATGRPELVAFEPVKGTQHTRSQRFQLRVYPEADTDYTLNFQYFVLPQALTGQAPWTYGGALHAETLLQSCLAIAEQRVLDKMDVQTAKWTERLAASVSMDRQMKPASLGYNGDNSDDMGRFRRMRRDDQHITFAGTEYD